MFFTPDHVYKLIIFFIKKYWIDILMWLFLTLAMVYDAVNVEYIYIDCQFYNGSVSKNVSQYINLYKEVLLFILVRCRKGGKTRYDNTR